MEKIEGRTIGAPAPVASYSQAIRMGSIVTVAGQAGVDPKTGVIVSDDVGAQTTRALANIQAALAACGASMEAVARIDVFLSTMEDFDAMNRAYSEAFRPPYPTRTTVAVNLAPDLKVEITALAVIGDGAR